jgi:hypothetical protein
VAKFTTGFTINNYIIQVEITNPKVLQSDHATRQSAEEHLTYPIYASDVDSKGAKDCCIWDPS